MSRSVARSGPVIRVSGSHARIGRSQSSGVITHDAGAGRGVVGNADHPVQSVTHLLDVRDEDDLREPVAEATQQGKNVLAARYIERTEDRIDHYHRQRQTRATIDHLRDTYTMH